MALQIIPNHATTEITGFFQQQRSNIQPNTVRLAKLGLGHEKHGSIATKGGNARNGVSGGLIMFLERRFENV